MADSAKYNMRNPAVKRILQEVKEMQREPSDEYISVPLEDNIFEWHFAVRGPRDSEFEGGIYHGRIILPHEYPFKPPSFMLLSPNGRFEVQTKICLSISQHHPEHWQPSWSVRTALVALIAFMPTKPDGALGSLDHTKEERRWYAVQSRLGPPKFGSPERQKVIDQVHEQMLQNAPPVPDAVPVSPRASGPTEAAEAGEATPAAAPAAGEAAAQEEAVTSPDTEDTVVADLSSSSVETSGRVEESATSSSSSPPNGTQEAASDAVEAPEASDVGGASNEEVACPGVANGEQDGLRRRLAQGSTPPLDAGVQLNVAQTRAARTTQQVAPPPEDRWLTRLAYGLFFAIVAILLKKFLKTYLKADA